jgi:hypothetical protein
VDTAKAGLFHPPTIAASFLLILILKLTTNDQTVCL